ncbi:MAG: hypothetical protein ACOYN6_00490 [Ignavibacteria bacterium]
MDFIPSADSLFFNWVKIFAEFIDANFAALGLTAAQNTELQAFLAKFLVDYPEHLSAQATATSLAQRKDSSRSKLEIFIRELTALIQANSAVTNEQRAALGITVPKSTKTPSPVPATRPMAYVDNKNRLDHTIHFFDEATPKSKAKPEGVRACEIWMKIGGTPPTDAKELTYLASDTRSPYIVHFNGEDAGKMAHYMLRWLNTRNEPGPWSETISVTISG